MIVAPGFKSPLASASSIIANAIRSFTLPPGLKYSTFARTGVLSPLSAENLLSANSGVLPISSVSLFTIFAIFFGI